MSDAAVDPRYAVLIDQLAERVQQSLKGEEELTEGDLGPILRGLREAGFEKHHRGRPLQVLVEDRIVDKHPEPAIHRRAELRALLQTVEDAWESASDLK